MNCFVDQAVSKLFIERFIVMFKRIFLKNTYHTVHVV